MSRLLLLAALLVGTAASASTTNFAEIAGRKMRAALHQRIIQPLARFNVGDKANYSMTIDISGGGGGAGGLPGGLGGGGTSGGITGTMTMSITAVSSTGVTIDQNVDFSSIGQQEDVVEVIDPNTGNVISVTVNGQPQTPPAANDIQITSQTLTTITVPAGTFKCQDVKMHMVSENTDAEQWSDMNDVPVGGMLKMTTTEQGYPLEADLTSFSKGS